MALQLSLLTGETATAAYLHSKGVPRAKVNAGHSLGQYPGAVESGFISFEDAFGLTILRAKLMTKASEARETAVGIVYDLRRRERNLVDLVEQRLVESRQEGEDGAITILNHRYQVLAGGPRRQIEALVESIQHSHPHIRADLLPLILSHHELLLGAQKEFNQALEMIRSKFNENAVVPLLSDVRNKLMTKASSLRSALSVQLIRTVIWDYNMLRLQRLGIKRGIEIGPGNIFDSMARLADLDMIIYPTNDLAVMDEVVSIFAIPSRIYSVTPSSTVASQLPA